MKYRLSLLLIETAANNQNTVMQYNTHEHIEPMSISYILSRFSSLETYIEHNNESPPPLLPHCMATRSQLGITKPNPICALLTNCSFVKDLKKLKDALTNLVWLDAMHEELRALDQNNTWVLVPVHLI